MPEKEPGVVCIAGRKRQKEKSKNSSSIPEGPEREVITSEFAKKMQSGCDEGTWR